MKHPTDLQFGALAPSLVVQLEGVLPKKELQAYDDLALSITKLHIKGILPDAQAHAARKRLVKRMEHRQRELLTPKRTLKAV